MLFLHKCTSSLERRLSLLSVFDNFLGRAYEVVVMLEDLALRETPYAFVDFLDRGEDILYIS